MEYVMLNNGVEMPMLGYGTWQTSPRITEENVTKAIAAGYRMIDTAQCYGNESQVGNAVLKSGISRGKFFVTTKTYTNGYAATKRSIEQSLEKLKLGYIDLLLIHEPVSDNIGTYKALEEAYQEGKARAIGLSNFYGRDLEEILDHCDIRPTVDQIETHVFWQHRGMRVLLDQEKIQLESWAPFAEGMNGMFQNPVLLQIAQKYQRSIAQIILRFFIQDQVIVIPKSLKKEHIENNFAVFDFVLEASDMEAIRRLDTDRTLFFWP